MSYEPEQESQENAEGAENTDGAAEATDSGADDLNAALSGGGEMNFVAETKQPMSKGTMIVVGLLLACGAATYFMYVKSGPSEAVAAGSSKDDEVVKGFLSGSEQNVKKMREMLDNTEKVVNQFKTQATETQVPLAKLANPAPFQREKPKPDEDVEARDKERQLAALKTKIADAVSELRLQTIIHKDPRKASVMINGRLLRKGETIKVADGKVVFTIDDTAGNEPQKFELKMKQ
jgi:hypothetical protein